MKKLFSFLFVMVLGFAMVACSKNGGDEAEDAKVTINFETNGGSAVNSITIDAKNVGTFVLPQNPAKEGYAFAGWYTDSALTKAFDALNADNKSITLYAKWEEEGKGIAANLSFTFAVKLNASSLAETEDAKEELANVDVSGNLALTLNVEDDTVEELKDLKAALGVTLTLKNDSKQSFGEEADAVIAQLTAAPIVASIYISGGYAYLSYGLVSYKVDLERLVEFVSTQLEALYEGYGSEYLPEGTELPEDPAEVSEFVLNLINYYVEEFDIDLAFFGELLSQLLVFIPEAKVVDGTTTFAITQTDFNADVDSLAAYLKANEERIITKLYDTVEGISEKLSGSREEYYDDYREVTISRSKAGWSDNTDTFHPFSEDLADQNFGIYYREVSVYYCYYVNAYYLTTSTPWKIITEEEYKALFAGKTVTDEQGNQFTYGTPSYKKADGTVVSLLENVEQLEEDNIGYYSEHYNYFKVYMTDEKWDIATGKLFDQRAYDIQTAISGLDEGLEVVPGYIKQAIKINEIKLVLTDKSYALNFNVEVATEPFKELVEVDAKLHVNFALTASYAKSKVTVTLPDLSQAVDLTDSILSNGPEAGADE